MSFPALPFWSAPGVTSGSVGCDYPSVSNVLEGTTYAFGSMVGTYVCPSPTPPAPVGMIPFSLIALHIVARVAYALGTTTDWVRQVANDDYELSEYENLFAFVRFYGPFPADPTTGGSFGNDGAGRWRRVVGRRFRVYVYTRSDEDTQGGDEIALGGDDETQNVTTPPTLPGQYVSEELLLNGLDNWTPTYVDSSSVTRPLTIGPVHWADSNSGPPVRPPEQEIGIVRSHLDFEVYYTLPVQKTEPAPDALPVPNLNNA